MPRRLRARDPVSRSPHDDHDQQAEEIASLFVEHADEVAAWASRLGGPMIDVDDIVQEVFVVLHRRLFRFRRESSARTWLYGITTNIVHQQRRKARRRRWFGRGQPQDRIELERPAQPTPIEELERHRRTLAVYRVLDEMRAHHRDVLILFEIEGLSGEEISELTRIALATVWVRLHRAREEFGRIARRLIPDEVDEIEARLSAERDRLGRRAR